MHHSRERPRHPKILHPLAACSHNHLAGNPPRIVPARNVAPSAMSSGVAIRPRGVTLARNCHPRTVKTACGVTVPSGSSLSPGHPLRFMLLPQPCEPFWLRCESHRGRVPVSRASARGCCQVHRWLRSGASRRNAPDRDARQRFGAHVGIALGRKVRMENMSIIRNILFPVDFSPSCVAMAHFIRRAALLRSA